MEDDYKETLKLESTLRKLSNGKDALAWGITVPESAHTNVKKQLSLTLLKGNFVLMLGGIVTDTITEGASQQLLLNTAETLQTSDRPIDLRKLQEAIRKEASLPMADPVDNSKATIKGRIFRSDTNQPIPNAEIVLMDENKSAKQVSRIEALTDAKGNYTLDRVPAGSYTVSIRARYKTPEDVPCKLLLGKTSDKNSNVIVIGDADGVVEQVFIKGFEVKMGKMMSKDFDFACTSLFGN